MKISAIIDYLNKRFPLDLASDFDSEKIGLVIGDGNVELKNILLALDLNLDVLLEAINFDANLIIVHHPFIFHPLTKIHFQDKYGKILSLMFEKQISLYVTHTPLDVGKGGVNDTLARLLGIQDLNYEIAKDKFIRYGKIKAIFLKDLAAEVKEKFELTGLRMAGNPDQVIRYLGVVGGSGGHESDIDYAIALGLDCYITSEVSLHAAQKAVEHNLAIIEVNHGVEKFVLVPLGEELKEEFALSERIRISKIETDPFVTIK
ncbi:MAG TPA: Nif3-like dinuclear metal center hexameric protein [Bacilli bacterium]